MPRAALQYDDEVNNRLSGNNAPHGRAQARYNLTFYFTGGSKERLKTDAVRGNKEHLQLKVANPEYYTQTSDY